MPVTLEDVEAKLKKVKEATEFPSKIENEETRFALIAIVQATEDLADVVKDVKSDVAKLQSDFEAHKTEKRGLKKMISNIQNNISRKSL